MNHPINLRGLINFRDLAHYPATDSNGQIRRIKAGHLFRAGHLHDVDSTASTFLASLHINLVADFRTLREQQQRPNRLTFSPLPEILSLPVQAGSGSSFRAATQNINPETQAVDGTLMAFVMQEMNRSLLIDHADSYRAFFMALLATQPETVLVQCASGKDRTGIAIALLLAALGVDRETIMADYLFTNQCLKSEDHLARATADFGESATSALGQEALAAMYEVRPSYMEAVFETIDRQWGTTAQYLTEALGVDANNCAMLQTLYLEPVT